MALSKGMRHMDDLPDECFAQILDLVPIRDIFVLMRVSKRWTAACRYIVRERQSLSIGDGDCYEASAGEMGLYDWHRNRPTEPLDNVSARTWCDSAMMMKSLNQMENIKRLCVCDLSLKDIRPFIQKFADQLTLLEVDFAISDVGSDVFPHLTHLKCSYFDAKTSAAFPKLAVLIISGLTYGEKLPNMRLPSLKELLIISFMDDAELVREFILANAENLTMLQTSGLPLRLDRAFVFPKLMKVDCRDVDEAGRCPFPALTHLTVGRPVRAELLSSLPADQMLSLEVRFNSDKKNVFSAISKMENLKSLKLTDDAGDESFGPFSCIFDNMHLLEKVKLVACGCRDEHDDRMIATLANQNPMLSDINFHRFRLTDAGLTSLAQLQHLTDICLYQIQSVTTAGVLTLLRGASRNVIRKFCRRRKRGRQSGNQ